ncbi:hypothetical protein CLV84_4244 [Neolewinella xylanilytica]|uniref:Tetratricopeptide repeat protein n=1 Tax=Neolewinella xylanilytica TaxID=1514080 RepID=A0A2S6I085_9BACT|nr:acetylxylan esterase [Neolewinella xylanilytica]PPK84094.1 hypothetical protein CLV84_4244 [Neolewinella xylanilytica]
MRLTLSLLFTLLITVSLSAERLEDRLRMLMPGDGQVVSEERRLVEKHLEDLLRRLDWQDRLNQHSRSEQIAQIAERLNKELLREFEAGATLTDAVREGRYSDATAAVFYALSLEHFNIPHEIYVDHWEAYLVADPAVNGSRIRHPLAEAHGEREETSFRRDYLALVRRTVEFDLPSLSDGQSDSIFYHYYYQPDQRLTLRQLSAYQQLRQAQRAYRAGDYPTVATYLERARLLDHRPAIDVLDRAAELQATALGVLQNDQKVDQLFESWRSEPANPYYPTALLRQFDRRQRELLAVDTLDALPALVHSFVLRAPTGAEAWETRIRLLRDIRLMEYYQDRGKAVQALQMAETLLRQDGENPHFRAYVAELSLYDLRRNYPEPDDQVDRAQVLAAKYPFVADHPRYADIVLRQSARKVRDHFAADREKEALRELNYFRAQLERLTTGNDERLWTLTAYVAASNYYFAKTNYERALGYITEALAHHPDSDFLLHQRDLLGRY